MCDKQDNQNTRMKILVAGIGGASLGTEIVKSLHHAGQYEIYGCDISPYAYGHYMSIIKSTSLVRKSNYVHDILKICLDKNITFIVPGGEEPSVLLARARELLLNNGITLVGNTTDVVRLCSDKAALFSFLMKHGVAIPRTYSVTVPEELEEVPVPCIIKPAMGSGGSSFVQLAGTLSDAKAAVAYLLQNHSTPVIQEYIPEDEGEYTIGVLHTPEGQLGGSIAMRRMFNAKLSVMAKTEVGLISSGYSQGLIDDFADLRYQAELIAGLCQSRGPLNIQGRVRNGILLPFEINPRFSATTYLRSLAGFNEVDMFIKMLSTGIGLEKPTIHFGYYLRTLTETFVKPADVKQ